MNSKSVLHKLIVMVSVLILILTQPFAAVQAGHSPAAREAVQLAGDELWSRFPMGTDMPIYAVAASGSDVYVGGDFTMAGNVPANHIARWSNATHKWYALGQGINNRVESIAIFGTLVYAGGYFTQAGGQSISDVAQWNTLTQSWSALGSGVMTHSVFSPEVKAVAIDNSGGLFIGGAFESVGGVSAMNIAHWSSGAWTALAGGLGDSFASVEALAVSGTDVYAGGSFTTPSTGIAHWNGSSWTGLGSGTVNSTYKDVAAVATSGTLVYIGGRFNKVTDSTDHLVNNIAVWNGSAWSALGSTPNDGVDAGVYTLKMDASGNIYAGGQFTTAGGSMASHIARWNGVNWSGLTNGFSEGADANIYTIFVNGPSLYVGGAETTAGGVNVGHIGRFDASASIWYGLGSSVDGTIYSLALKGSNVYLSGSFNSVNGVVSPKIGNWNAASDTWPALGIGGITGCTGFLFCAPSVNAILVGGNDIFITGNFLAAGGNPANGIARWNTDDQQWHAMGSGLSCLALFCSFAGMTLAYDPVNSRLYVGGTFDGAGGVAAANLAVWSYSSGWNSVTWQDTITHPINPGGTVNALAWNGTYLYVGGSFSSPFSYLFSTDIHGVYSLGSSPLNGAVNALVADASNLYVGGVFTAANGSSTTNYLARLTSPTGPWLAVGAGLNNVVYALALRRGRLAAGGLFTQVGAQGMNFIGLWNGSTWSGLGSGTDGPVNSVAMDGDFIYAGGQFTHAGGKPAVGFSRWGQYHVYLPSAKK